jgi:hypothetical protein
MSTIIRSVHNTSSTASVHIQVPGYDASKPSVSVPASSTLDLFSVLNAEQLSSIQGQLSQFVASGLLTVAATADSSLVELAGEVLAIGPQTLTNTTPSTDALTITNTTPSKGLWVNGKIVGYRDNGAAFAVKGLQSPTEGTAVVGNYEGIFYSTGYDLQGTLNTRAILGGNLEMDVEIQSPHALLLTANDNTQNDCFVRIGSTTNIILEARTGNQDAPVAAKYLIVDRLDQSVHAVSNSSDVNLTVNAGNLRLLDSVTTGTVILNSLTDGEIAALTPVKGMIVYAETDDTLRFYNGAWKTVQVV